MVKSLTPDIKKETKKTREELEKENELLSKKCKLITELGRLNWYFMEAGLTNETVRFKV